MIWIANKKYTPEYYDQRLKKLHRRVRLSTRHMALVVICSVAVNIAIETACIYGL